MLRKTAEVPSSGGGMREEGDVMSREYEILKYTHDMHPESHFHEYYEIFISLCNEGKLFVKEKGYSLKFGMVFFLSPLEIHRCFCHGNKNYDRYVIHFTQEFLQSISTERTDLVSFFNALPLALQMQSDEIAQTLEQLSRLTQEVGDGFAADVERHIDFSKFLLTMARVAEQKEGIQIPTVKSDRRINDVLQYIHENYNQDITIDNIAETFFISKSRLSQIFKDATGFSVGNYIVTYRIKRACALLRHGVSVQEAGEQVGFHNSTHFIKMFKKHTGYSPGKFSKEEQMSFSRRVEP